MIIYNDTIRNFIKDTTNNLIASKVKDKMYEANIGSLFGSQYYAVVNSMQFMKNIIDYDDIPKDAEVAIEYQIPQTSKRVDFLISGNNGTNDNVLIVELKQWEKATKVSKNIEHSIRTFTGGSERLVAHPSYQAFSYATLIKNTSEVIQNKNIDIISSAYLHNFLPEYKEQLNDEIFSSWIKESPFFISTEFEDFRKFIKKHIKYKSKDSNLLYKIDNGRLKPSKALQDAIVSMMKGNQEFLLIDDQITAYDICRDVMKHCKRDGKKRTIIIEGGPGTGKSVLALNLLQDFIKKEHMSCYVTKNAAPRNAFLELISKSDLRAKTNIKSLFRSPFGLSNVPVNKYDVLIVDESHRLVKQMFRDFNGKNQIFEIINASLLSIFLIDENQKITTKDIGSIENIMKIAKELGSEVYSGEELRLASQFRCNGSDAYIQFLNNVLQIDEYVDLIFEDLNYDLRVFDDPNELRDELRKINESKKHNNKARMVAGYCYPWNIKNNREYDYDIALENDFKAKWNLPNDNTFAINPKSFEEIGCIHTVQGLEFDYVGVIIGRDLRYDYVNQKIITDKTYINRDDNSSGIRKTDDQTANQLIKNTYKTLLTRGQKGCFIYCEDKSLANHIRDSIKRNRI